MAEAFTFRRLVDAPVAPSAMVTVPDVMEIAWEALDVKLANVPTPAMAAATASVSAPTAMTWGRRMRSGRFMPT